MTLSKKDMSKIQSKVKATPEEIKRAFAAVRGANPGMPKSMAMQRTCNMIRKSWKPRKVIHFRYNISF